MKKVVSIILAGLMILSLAACSGNKGEKVTLYAETWEGDNVRLSVDFYYPEDAGIKLEGDEEYPNWIDMKYEAKNMGIGPALFEDTTFDANKKYAQENEETYEEFKIGDYDCYGYESFGGYYIYVHLEEVSETTDRYLIIDTKTLDYSKKYVEGKAQYEDEVVKKIVESFEYHGVVEYPPVTEETEK